MEQIIKKVLKEETDDLKQKFVNSLLSLGYIIETTTSSNIESVEIENINFIEKYPYIAGDLIIKTYCEDHDFRSLGVVLDRADDEILDVTRNYSFTKEGSLIKKTDERDWYLYIMPIGVSWTTEGQNQFDVIMKYHIYQDEYDD